MRVPMKNLTTLQGGSEIERPAAEGNEIGSWHRNRRTEVRGQESEGRKELCQMVARIKGAEDVLSPAHNSNQMPQFIGGHAGILHSGGDLGADEFAEAAAEPGDGYFHSGGAQTQHRSSLSPGQFGSRVQLEFQGLQ